MIKRYIRSLAKRCGYEIDGSGEAFAVERSRFALIRQEKINLVLDVGANTGEFAGELRSWGYSGRAISFEPLTAAHAELRKRAATDPNCTIADRTAIGATSKEVEIHVSGNSVSSSILEMLPAHSKAAPKSTYVGTERVQINRLDDLRPLAATDRTLLKIDVQGYEREVLEGAQNILKGCVAVIVEMSLVPLYNGQIFARELWDLLALKGFELWSLEPGFRHPETRQVLQFDGIFVRRNKES